jgi:coenzyme F420-reducing hydrogenase delta subunit
MQGEDSSQATARKILVFSTDNISDPGIDLAGSAHMEYPASVLTLAVPCSSMIKPKWVLYALEHGYDGVFVAADGSDCAFLPDCTKRTGKLVQEAQSLIKEHGIDPRRLKMAAVCSVCAESFVSHMKKFRAALDKLDAAQEKQ